MPNKKVSVDNGDSSLPTLEVSLGLQEFPGIFKEAQVPGSRQYRDKGVES